MNTPLDAFGAIFMALVLVALAHPDPQLRASAERLLSVLFGGR
ncbi:hypothetical protein ACFW4X_21035 [Streptomyces smyrnaeus]